MAFPTAAATTLYTSFILFDPSPTDDHRHGSSPTFTSESQPSDPSDPSNDSNNSSIWENWSGGARFGVLIGILLFVAAIVLLSAWCCRCCCFKGRRGRHDPPGPAPANTYTGGNVALHNLPNSGTAGAARSESQQHLQPQAGLIDPDAPPPSYDAIRHDTIVPPSEHHRVGGEGVGEDEEFNVVADGKTPLSEIPFEDVDINALSQPSSASSASHSHNQGFEERHRWGGGDTTGHTNA